MLFICPFTLYMRQSKNKRSFLDVLIIRDGQSIET